MQILEAAVIEFAKRYGIDKAIEYFGLDKQTENPKYAISLGNFTFDPVNALKRTALSKTIQGAMGGKLSGIMGPAALIGGAFFLGQRYNPLNPKSVNYNPNLKGQIADLSRRGMLNDRFQITKGPLAGKNLVSMFGTNDYGKMLDKKVDYFENRIKAGKPISEKNYAAAKNEQIENKGIGVNIDGVTMSGADYQGTGAEDNAASSGSKSGGFSSAERGASLHGAKGGLARYYRGGIANL